MRRRGAHFRPTRWFRNGLVHVAVTGLLASGIVVSTEAGIVPSRQDQIDKSARQEPPRTLAAYIAGSDIADLSVPSPLAAPTSTTSTTSTIPATTTTTEPSYMNGNRGEMALAPGAKLPSDAACAKRVHKTAETVPANSAANHKTPDKTSISPGAWGGSAGGYTSRVTGKYTGTTDEIIQWASCKWGLDVDAVRAQVKVESNGRQGATAGLTDDQSKCVGAMQTPCPTAFGLLQIRSDFQPGTYPWSASSTAFNLDYGLGMKRACYDGKSYLGPKTRGDAWGCVGAHYSGAWWDDAAKSYVDKVRANYR